MTITDTQRQILALAAQHPGGMAAPPATLPPAPRSAVAKALLKAGLLDVAEADGQQPELAWKLDGEPGFLRITQAGRQAVGAADAQGTSQTVSEAAEVAPADAANAVQDAPTCQDAGIQQQTERDSVGMPHTAPTEPQDGVQAPQVAGHPVGAPTASTALQARAAGLRDAARQVLAAWDAEAGQHAGMGAAIEALRAALPAGRAAQPQREPGAARARRAGTKQEAVLAMLRRAEGASGPDIIVATGWQPHTVRGFLAGLKRRGIEVQFHERVRQVGPGKEGAKGSYTVYRIAEAG